MSYIRYRAVWFLRDRHTNKKKSHQDSSVKSIIGQSSGMPSWTSTIFIIYKLETLHTTGGERNAHIYI